MLSSHAHVWQGCMSGVSLTDQTARRFFYRCKVCGIEDNRIAERRDLTKPWNSYGWKNRRIGERRAV